MLTSTLTVPVRNPVPPLLGCDLQRATDNGRRQDVRDAGPTVTKTDLSFNMQERSAMSLKLEETWQS